MREANLIDCILAGAVCDMRGRLHIRPRLSLSVVVIGVQSKFGTCSSMMRQVYIRPTKKITYVRVESQKN